MLAILVWRFPALLDAPQVWRRWSVMLALLRDAVLSDVAAWCAGLLQVLCVCAVVAGIVGACALLLCNPHILIGAVLVAGYAVVFMPRKAVRP